MEQKIKSFNDVSVAPMMDVTDRHFRYMMRLLTRKSKLYTEMIVDQTLIHQQARLDYFLGFNPMESPLVVQLGGNNPDSLAESAGMCEEFGGYSEINLNCGCPSPRVSQRCFGAALMLEPELVRQITSQMVRRATSTPVTVKCRIGADHKDSYEDLVNFIATVKQSGVNKFIVHARKCHLSGLSAAKNRTIPPLKYDVVHKLAKDFPDLSFGINGGITTYEQVRDHLGILPNLNEVMVGRAAWHNPWMFRNVDSQFYNSKDPGYSRREVIEEHLKYCRSLEEIYGNPRLPGADKWGWSPFVMVRPLMYLFGGVKGSRSLKRTLSEIWQSTNGDVDIEDLITDALIHISDDILDRLPSDEDDTDTSSEL